jgi:hypothetical protein
MKRYILSEIIAGKLPNPYELRPEDRGEILSMEFGVVIHSDVGRKVYWRDSVLSMESMGQAQTRRAKARP